MKKLNGLTKERAELALLYITQIDKSRKMRNGQTLTYDEIITFLNNPDNNYD